MTVQEQAADTLARTQIAWADAVVAWAGNVQRALTIPAGVLVPINPVDVVDPAFDAAQHALNVQRQVAKAIVGVAFSFVEAGRQQVESVGAATRRSAETAADAVRQESEAIQEEARQQARAAQRDAVQDAKARYEEMTKAELQQELEKREIPKTGNVDELRKRLVDSEVNGVRR